MLLQGTILASLLLAMQQKGILFQVKLRHTTCCPGAVPHAQTDDTPCAMTEGQLFTMTSDSTAPAKGFSISKVKARGCSTAAWAAHPWGVLCWSDGAAFPAALVPRADALLYL